MVVNGHVVYRAGELEVVIGAAVLPARADSHRLRGAEQSRRGYVDAGVGDSINIEDGQVVGLVTDTNQVVPAAIRTDSAVGDARGPARIANEEAEQEVGRVAGIQAELF